MKEENMEDIIQSMQKLSKKSQKQIVINVFPTFFSRLKEFADKGEISHKEAMDELEDLIKTWKIK